MISRSKVSLVGYVVILYRALLEKRVELVVQVQQKKTDVLEKEEQKVKETEMIVEQSEEEGLVPSKNQNS